jgi:hypothetical protein
MNKPESVETTIDQEVADRRGSSQLRPSKHGPSGFSIVARMRHFRHLNWADRLNLLLATILGCALVLALSPLLLLSWIRIQLAKHRAGASRPGHLRTDSET